MSDPYFSSVSLLALNYNAAANSFLDQSLSAKTITKHGSAVNDTSTAPSGDTTSGKFVSATLDYLTVADDVSLQMGSSDFTIEGFIKSDADGGSSVYVMTKQSDATFSGFALIRDSSNNIGFYATSNGTSWDIASAKLLGSIIVADGWKHFAVSRIGSNWYASVGGVQGSTWSNSAAMQDAGAPFTIMSNDAGGNYMNGHLASVRVTKGTGRYSGNFTPPTLPFPVTIPKSQFATNCSVCAFKLTGPYTNLASRTRHYARSAVTSIQAAFPNWVIDWFFGPSFVEAGSGSVLTLHAAIEYGGVTTEFQWSGSTSLAIADGATSALSDPLAISIPAGATFFIRSFYSTVNGAVITCNGTGSANGVAGIDAANGEQCRTNGTDQTPGTGALTAGSPLLGVAYKPILLVAALPAGTKSFLILGDSRQSGQRDVFTGTSGDHGQIVRTVGAGFGYSNVSIPADQADFFITSHALRVALAPYFSHVVNAYGVNNRDSVAATIAGWLSTIAGYFSIPVYQTTINGETTSSDLWATLVNQTGEGTNHTHLVDLNDNYIRALAIQGVTGFIEVADVLESARDSGLWAVNGTANWYTDDGVHETNTANIAVQAALSNTPLFFTAPAAVAATTSTVVISGFQPPPALSDEFSILTRRAFVGTEKPVVSKMKSPRGQWGRGMKQT